MSDQKDDRVRDSVRDRYGALARRAREGCGSGPASCCDGVKTSADAGSCNQKSSQMGYSPEELAAVPEGANMGLGCGNPQAIAALQPGETVLDLGSGAGFDCFLAAGQIGSTGKVIGVDMTPDMISKSRENSRESEYDNVEFRLGEIENLPVADGVVDVIISNCVINLSPDKRSVFLEASRVLKPGGRLAVSDVVASVELPEEIRSNLALYSACVAGAASIGDLEDILAETGFIDIKIDPKDESREFIRNWAPEYNLEDYIQSATIEARKPL